MTRRLRRFAVIVLMVAGFPSLASAGVDLACGINATSAISGVVRNVKGDRLGSITIQARQANKESPIVAQTTTAANGTYLLCVGHDTYDVRASLALDALYATANRQATTFTDVSRATDFTLEHKLNLTITPQAVSIGAPLLSKNVTWTVRSKAPCISYPSNCTDIQMTLEHLGTTILHPAFSGTELGGPGAGGWNRWTYTAALSNPLPERAYFANARGFALNNSGQIVATTERAIDPYFVDNQKPLFGPATTGLVNCDGSAIAGPFTPTVTTNPLALISVGVCDPLSNGGRSSLDPYSVSAEVRDPNNIVVSGGGLVLNQLTIQYLPSAPLMLGVYRFRYTISDNAGNQAVSGYYELNVTNAGGTVPTISGVQPGNVGEGQSLGIVAGSHLTTPSSRPMVAFQARDADGQNDLSAGSLHVRIYGPDGATLVYDYDVTTAPCATTAPSCPANSGFFNQGTGRFDASGFSLSGKPPGVYVASASISDHGGNAATRTWRWILVAAT